MNCNIYSDSPSDCLQALKNKGITKLYHFTDRKNIPSIIANGGLYSWYYCESHSITPIYASSPESRMLDLRKGLSDYVRLSFVPDHPMKYVAKREGRIHDPVVLIIDIDIVLTEGTKYSTKNATDNFSSIGPNVNDVNNIDYNIFRQSYFDLCGDDKKKYQAEVLIPSCVPIRKITNIDSLKPRPVHVTPPLTSTYNPSPTYIPPSSYSSPSSSKRDSSSDNRGWGCFAVIVILLIIVLLIEFCN